MKILEIYISEDELKSMYGEIEKDGFLMLFATSSIFTDPEGIIFIREIFNEIEKENDIHNREERTKELLSQEEQDNKGKRRNIKDKSRRTEEKPN